MGVLRDMLRHWPRRVFTPAAHLRAKYEAFKGLLDADEKALVLIAELDEVFYGTRCVDPARVQWLCRRLVALVQAMVERLSAMCPACAQGLTLRLERISAGIHAETGSWGASSPALGSAPPYILTLDEALDRPELAGGKAANLARAKRAGLDVPPALVVSAAAFNLFIEAGGLRPRLDRLLRQVDLSSPDKLDSLCAELRAVILGAPLPEPVAEALKRAVASPELGGARLAVRSSALGEDGGRSFAGQYASELGVSPEDLPDAYQRILAAKYRPRAVAYRILSGLPDAQTPMAVLLMPMIEARAAGALFSREDRPGRAGAEEQAVAIFALAGLGDRLMSGQDSPRALRLSRPGAPGAPAEILDDAGPQGVELSQRELDGLARSALALEQLFKSPQEVEWALDRTGRVFVLQSRPHCPEPATAALQPGLLVAEPLASGLSRVASGAACGPVFHLRDLTRLAEVPEGAVLAVPGLSPTLGKCIGRVEAVLAGSGSRASHFASVAREFGLPVLADAGELLARLADGDVVSVDADAGAVYPGRVEAVLAGRGQGREVLRQGAMRRYAGLTALTCRLSLTDPDSPDFSPQSCKSLHDVVRFCHECAVGEMFTLADRTGRGLTAARRLDCALPLSMFVLDLGQGLRPGNDQTLRPEDFASVPMRAFWQGLAHPDERWDGSGLHFDWQEFDRVSAGIFRKDSKLLASYALVSSDYLHLQVRFGYHFAVLDSLCGPRAEGNYIGLRFKGGGGLEQQRLLRLGFIGRVLTQCGFTVNTRGDMLDARHARADQNATSERLTLLGRLLARTRLMDLRLVDETQAAGLADDFLAELGALARSEQ
ncbi:MAG: PEP/pyruvate-binding domain-containing protein [Humidesulfovibrio sp.]|uniref:PEP/pyruvate-binding domain-containing protein n=1 Tax=Humidesulfovibrio sp. TaxID=2910988 RepID=UPI0027FBD8A6|nr:PEP/pyruvate-binding domain-containing protein [Humidesulfovibrio sp.]MDQ7835333.1 PEP/pyruvate-binding domain-containing protein [Humidesulfovibrio sp.]